MDGIDPYAIFEEHKAWARTHADPLARNPLPHDNEPDPERRLRVGYVSPDFRQHSVAWFAAPLLAAHDRSRIEVTCYSDAAKEDAMTARLRKSADRWHEVARLEDAALAELVRGHRIDILVDLAGHTAVNRLLALARKPAPVQITWLGYPNTTGMRQMDYRFTDAVADPAGASDSLNVERLIRLPRGFLCYEPPADCPEARSPPSLASDHITFASFNNYSKLSPATAACWAVKLIQPIQPFPTVTT